MCSSRMKQIRPYSSFAALQCDLRVLAAVGDLVSLYFLEQEACVSNRVHYTGRYTSPVTLDIV